jgi:hypothetical protein
LSRTAVSLALASIIMAKVASTLRADVPVHGRADQAVLG